MDDQDIARGIRAGDHEAFRELVERYGPSLLSFLLYRLGNRADAEDAYAEVLMRVWQNARRYEESGRLKAWLFTIAHRRALDMLEQRGRRGRDLCSAGTAEPLAQRTAAAEPGPEREAQSREVGARFQKALAALPEEQREVFLMREYGELSFSEVAQSVGCPLGTALARMRYAVLKLRRELEEFHA